MRPSRSVLSPIVRVAVIRAARDWVPRSWDDAPQEGRIISIATARSRAYAEGMIYAFNAKRLDQPDRPGEGRKDRRWAVLLHPRAELLPGHECYRRLPTFDGG